MAADDLSAHWRSPLLGEPRELPTAHGTVEAFERGEGPPVVLAHGWFANANLWRNVVDRLADGFACVALDLPLGSHRHPMAPLGDLAPSGVAGLIVEAIEALDRGPVTLVGNDSGGAYAQIAAAARPDLVDRLALTSCETPYDTWPPPPFDQLPQAVQEPEAVERLFDVLRDPEAMYSDLAYGLLVTERLEPRVAASYVRPCLEDPAVVHDARKAISSASIEAVREAAERLIEGYARPVLFAWSPDDPVFPIDHARRYAARLRDGRVVELPSSRSFTPEDRPQELAQAIASFAGAGAR
jgi:pimeloyl-ACP methyl ester carboxylesterase